MCECFVICEEHFKRLQFFCVRINSRVQGSIGFHRRQIRWKCDEEISVDTKEALLKNELLLMKSTRDCLVVQFMSIVRQYLQMNVVNVLSILYS